MRLIYFSPVPWASFAQRPHKFVEWFHGTRGGQVLWIEPYPTRLPQLADFRAVTAARGGAKLMTTEKTPAWLTLLQPRSLPIEPFPGAGMLNRLLWNSVLQAINTCLKEGDCVLGIGKPSELALQALKINLGPHSFYDAMDDFPAFYRGLSRIAMARREREIANRVTRISVSSTRLADRFNAHHRKLSLAPNACAVETLPPLSATKKDLGRPILGYVGTIAHWFDWHLVFALAEANPSTCIRLIGPIYAAPPGSAPRNIEFLPACDHPTAMKAMLDFSVGLIPFKRTDLTASVDPIKYYEYRAIGLPVLSTRFGEMARRDREAGVFLLDERSNLASLVKTAVTHESDPDEIQKFREANSWEARFNASGVLP